jgi:wobble nucleotide-excising tRNase
VSTAKKPGRAKREDSECTWCGDAISDEQADSIETYFDSEGNEFCSEMCLGQFEAGRRF